MTRTYTWNLWPVQNLIANGIRQEWGLPLRLDPHLNLGLRFL